MRGQAQVRKGLANLALTHLPRRYSVNLGLWGGGGGTGVPV